MFGYPMEVNLTTHYVFAVLLGQHDAVVTLLVQDAQDKKLFLELRYVNHVVRGIQHPRAER